MAEDYMALYKKALTGLETGGKKLEASLAEIEEGKRQAIGRGQQSLVSGGLGGTTVMGGVPLQAEKIAGRQRLGARGQAEETYLTTLASFAAFAQRGEEAQKQRQFEARQSYLQRQSQEAMQIRGTQTSRQISQPGDGYAQQFPSLYDQGETAVPDWTGGTGTGTGGIPGIGTYEQGWRGAQVIGEKGVLAGAEIPPQTGDYMSVAGGAGGPILGGGATTTYQSGFERWLKEQGKGATASTMMQYERAGKPYG